MTLKLKKLVSVAKNYLSLCFIAGLILYSPDNKAQTYRFKNFGAESTIPGTYLYNIIQDNNGFLWVGTGNGLAKSDGLGFYPVPYPDSITTRYVTASYKDSTGRIWFGCNDGALFYTSGNELVKYESSGFQSISQILWSNDGFLVVIPQEKSILRINLNKPSEQFITRVPSDIVMTCAAFAPDGKLLLGTVENLLYCTLGEDSLKIEEVVEGIEYTKVQSILPVTGTNSYLAGTEGSGVYLLSFEGGKPVLKQTDNRLLPSNLDVKLLFEAKDGAVWISTFGAGLIKVMLQPGTGIPETVTHFNTGNGLQSNDVRSVFEDNEGNIWAGLYGDGISMLVSQALYFYAPGDMPERNNIIYVKQEGNSYFLGTSSGYYFFDPSSGKTGNFFDIRNRIGTDVSAFLSENMDTVWAGTRGQGLFRVSRNGQVVRFFFSQNTGQNYIRHIINEGSDLWLATLDGVVILNKRNGTIVKKFNIEDRLPHNSINQVLILNDGRALAATECDRLYRITIENGVEIGRRVMTGYSRNKVLCYSQSANGDIWAGTAGNGMFWFTNDSIIHITTSNGLFSDFCYSIIADSKGFIWAGHERGFSRFDTNTGIVSVYPTDFAKNASCNPNAIDEDQAGRIIIGTTEGLIIYDKLKENNVKVVPKTNIVAVTINNTRYPLRSEYLLPYNRYTFKIDYAGIDLGNPEGVYYSIKMDNWDNRWSEMTHERQATYQLRDGKYRFNVISYNAAGISDNNPAFIDFYIKSPFWRTWWFISIVVISLSLLLVIVIREREKAQERIRIYLEEELDKRTSEVVKQKEKIELQNLEITDSINYARRIQSSILPDTNKLKEAFNDAFIIFYPRDIVSGDFYWFDRIDDERFMVVCADSTGHGVPGAFMSMIGSTLLQDIISRKGITKPSQILTLLDRQIFSTLNQNIEVGVSNDGMDMVVCEINIAKRHIRFASAMRPVIIIMGGEAYYIKGNRCSIGGESVIEKYFDDQEYYLGKGDSLYLFSDGFPDQFGGTEGKKMKIARLKTLIEDVHPLPMEEQKEIITKYYFDWKGDYDQVDDVLMMGIRL